MGVVAGGELGGILDLIALVGEHTDAIRSDLHQYHGLRLTDLGRRCTWGEFRAFIAWLPPEAALWRSLDSPRQWGWPEHLAAASAHALAMGNWQRGGGKGQRPKAPKPPGTTSADDRTFGTAMSVEDMRRVLDTWSDPPDDVLLGPDGTPMEVNDGD